MRLAVTLDLDWACDAAVEETLTYFADREIPLTVFATHRCPGVERALPDVEVGLHPFFGVGSSHGSSVDEVVSTVLGLPHNLPAFRCHRFEVGNTAREAMAAAGMTISSNVCTDLEVVPPFIDRCGLVEVPIYLEDGGYLRRGHSIDEPPSRQGDLVVLVHPMHFAVNTPYFQYMVDVKRSLSREQWRALSHKDLDRLRWRERGIRDVVVEFLDSADAFTTVGQLARTRLSRA